MGNVLSRADAPATTGADASRASKAVRPSRMGPWRDVLNVVEWMRYLTDALMVLLAARVLPLTAALWAADALGWLDVLLPTRAGRAARRDIAAATGLGGWPGVRLAARRCAEPRYALVYDARAAAGRDTLASWRFVEHGVDGVRQLIAERRSFILASMHTTAPTLVRLTLWPNDVFGVRANPRWQLSPFVLRTRLRVKTRERARGQLLGMGAREGERLQGRRLALMPNWWRHEQDWTKVPNRMQTVQETVLAKLAEAGTCVHISVDAFWDKPGAHRRQFAGSPARGFALGAARMARLAQCPIVPHTVALDAEPLTLHFDCGAPIEPPAVDDKGADVRTTDAVLDWLEAAIARYPTQYADHIGSERIWDPAQGRWVQAQLG